MLASLLKSFFASRAAAPSPIRRTPGAPLRLHVGGRERHPDWRILNVLPGENVDFLGSCADLSRFAGESVDEIYASHVIEHLGYQRDLPAALREFHRVLVDGGTLRVSVPDLDTLCALFLDPALDAQARLFVMRLMYGGQMDAADFHYVGLNREILEDHLKAAGFGAIERVDDLGLFDDSSRLVLHGRPISLNMVARKS